jgi:hypothetical protein
VRAGGAAQHRFYVGVGSATLVLTRAAGEADQAAYLLTDALGSVDTVTGDAGKLIEKRSYDAFGARRNPAWGAPPPAGGFKPGAPASVPLSAPGPFVPNAFAPGSFIEPPPPVSAPIEAPGLPTAPATAPGVAGTVAGGIVFILTMGIVFDGDAHPTAAQGVRDRPLQGQGPRVPKSSRGT